MEKIAKNASSRSVDQIPKNNNIFDKDGKRETEKTIIREQLLERMLRQKQLEEEVIKDMALKLSENFKPSDNVEARDESSNKPQNGGNLSHDQKRDLKKRVIGEEILSSWLRRKQLEEEVMTELFGEEMLQRGKDSIASDYPKVTSDTCNKPLSDLMKIKHAQDEGEGSGLVPCVHDSISLDGQAGNGQSPGNDTYGGLTVDLSIQSPPRAPNTTNPGMLIGAGKGAMTPSAGNGQSPGNDTDGGLTVDLSIQSPPREPNTTNPGMLIGSGKGAMTPSAGNGQTAGNDTDGGLTVDLSIQSPPREPNTTNPGMLIGSGKGAMTPSVNSVIPPIGGDNVTAGKTISKRKRWDCDLCNVITTNESVHAEHLRGKRHLAKLKASSKTATPLTSD